MEELKRKNKLFIFFFKFKRVYFKAFNHRFKTSNIYGCVSFRPKSKRKLRKILKIKRINTKLLSI